MSSREALQAEMEQILDDLIANARQMLQASSQEVSQEQLASLQDLQDRLIQRLVATDLVLQRDFPDSAVSQRIEEDLEQFQVINAEFIESVRKQKPVIQFEADKAVKLHHRTAKSNLPEQPGGTSTVNPKSKH